MNYTAEMLDQFITLALLEDVGDGDHTSLSTIPAGIQSKARLIIKEDGVLAGLEIACAIFQKIDAGLQVNIYAKDGQDVKYGDVVLDVHGSVHSILVAERLVLNIMQRMSGIATMTRQVVKKLEGLSTKILDTRKTTPNLRFLEKEAVKIGGGANHRFGLYDMILIKDNHVDYAGGIRNAIAHAKQYLAKTGRNLQIEIETRTLEEVQQALEEGGVQRIMFDNFGYEQIRKAVEMVNGRFETEASGGITIENVREYAACGVDYISMGALTHSVKSLDMSLKAF
jgi:nicotinate-nucleotide pyrophosphorylase (carboxylating)